MKLWKLLLLFPSMALAQDPRVTTFNQTGDRAASVSILGYRGPDNLSYVLTKDPTIAGLPVNVVGGSLSSGPIQYTRNGADTLVTLDTTTAANNRPLPFTLLAGDSLGPVDVGSGATTSATLRFRLVSDQTLAITCAACATETTLASIDTKTPALGQALAAASVPVVLTAAQVTTLTPQTNALTDTQLRASAVPVSVGTLPLPTGAATEATLSSLNGKVTAVNTGNVTVSASALPTGASTEATLSSLNGKVANNYGVATGAVRTASQVGNASGIADFGSGAATAQTLRVVPTTDSPNPRLGKAVVLTVRQNLNSDVIDTTYDQITSSTSATITKCSIFWPGNEPLWLSTGGVGSEVVLVYVSPGGIDDIPVSVAAGTRLAWRSESSTFSSGYGVITCYGI